MSSSQRQHKALVTLADREVRQWRSLAHRHFDPLWKSRIFKSRNAAYKWLARAMGLPQELTHRQRVFRLVRKTLSFSKLLENHIGAIWYFVHYYNLSLLI